MPNMPTTAPAPAKRCVHGECLGHKPEWAILDSQLVPNPGITGAATYWTRRHCGKAMTRYREVVVRECMICDRRMNWQALKQLAVCECCGYQRLVPSPIDGSPH